jgi:hypothetical protein
MNLSDRGRHKGQTQSPVTMRPLWAQHPPLQAPHGNGKDAQMVEIRERQTGRIDLKPPSRRGLGWLLGRITSDRQTRGSSLSCAITLNA